MDQTPDFRPAVDDSWPAILARAVTDPIELCRRLGLPLATAEAAQAAARAFPLLVTEPYLARIRLGDPADPLLRQILPTEAELAEVQGFACDPLDEDASTCVPGLLWKYAGRALLLVSAACAAHCRFCFRRHAWHRDGKTLVADLGPALERLAAETSIHEVILSGGDPLMADDDEVAALVARLAEVEHLSRLRVHTRLPVVIPQRITSALIEAIRATRLTPIVVVHVNHPAEIDAAVASGLGRLVGSGITVLSQGVLLREINDDVDVLAALYERLVDLGVMPYYLHQLDRVAGAAHFEVSPERGRELVESLRSRLPGYAVPRYARETPGASSKQRLA